MREILFKAKRTDNGEWIEGYLLESFNGDSYIATELEHILGLTKLCEVYGNTICQYTGLTDRNGKKIWENDIIRLEDYQGSRMAYVFYGDCGSWFYGGDGFSDEYVWNGQFKEVIGNVFDHPELLKGGAECT